MATTTGASYATPPRSDDDGEDIENINKTPPGTSAETQTTDKNPMFFDETSQPTPPQTMTQPQHSMQLINAGEKREMALDNIETVMTTETDQRAVAVLNSTTFETYYYKAKTPGSYKRTNYLKDLNQDAKEAADTWRVAMADARQAKVMHERAKVDPAAYLAGRNPLQMAKTYEDTCNEIMHAAQANYDAHRDKAEQLLAARKTRDSEAKEATVRRKQEAKRAMQERRDEELLRKSRDRIRKGRVTKRR